MSCTYEWEAVTSRNSTAPQSGQPAGGSIISLFLSSGLTVASKSLSRAIDPSEVSSIVQPDTKDERDVLKAEGRE